MSGAECLSRSFAWSRRCKRGSRAWRVSPHFRGGGGGMLVGLPMPLLTHSNSTHPLASHNLAARVPEGLGATDAA